MHEPLTRPSAFAWLRRDKTATLSPLCGERAGRGAISILLVLLLAGCVSKKQADLQARQAYMAGQAQAAKEWQAKRPPEVVVRGPVRNPVVPWTEGLTLAKAIVDADYTGFMNPMLVRVTRNGLIIEEMKGADLLHGRDVPLQPGDIVDIVP
jgi:hypothetical protein